MVGVDGIKPVSYHDNDFMVVGRRGRRICAEGIAVNFGYAAGVEYTEDVFPKPYACI